MIQIHRQPGDLQRREALKMRCLWTRRVNVSTCSHEQLAHTKTDAKPEGKRWQTDARKKKEKKKRRVRIRLNYTSGPMWRFQVCASCSWWSPKSYGPWFPSKAEREPKLRKPAYTSTNRAERKPLLCIFSTATRGLKPCPLVLGSTSYLSTVEPRSDNSPA